MQEMSKRVNMTSDGLALSPAEYADLLVQLAASGDLNPDNYGAGGSVEKFERAMADALGKEAAVVMPTGTMGNLLAVQFLAGHNKKVVCQQESHLFNDCGDCGPNLAGLQLLPVGKSATFTTVDVDAAINRANNGKVEAPIGVISIESPVRRLDGEMFEQSALQEVIKQARSNGVRLHLDGARLPVVAACTGNSMRALAAPFDTVYVSLYKCFNSLSGAIVAGDQEVMHHLRHWRRRNGGGMAQLWPIAGVAHHYLDNVVEGLEHSFEIARDFFLLLDQDPRFSLAPIANGSSVSRINLVGADIQSANAFWQHLKTLGVYLPGADGDPVGFTTKVNASWQRTNASELFETFQKSAKAANLG